MGAVKGIYQVFTLGIRFGGWISVCSRAEWRFGNSVGGTWRDFIRGGRWCWHKTLKLSLFLRISLWILLFLSFLLGPTYTRTFVTSWRCEWTSSLQGVGWRDRRNMLHFQRCQKAQARERERLDHWPVIALRSGQPCTCSYPSLLFIVIKSRHAICLPHQPAAALATQTLSIWTQALHVFSSFQPVAPHKREARGSVIYKDYQRNMMSKGKLKLCACPTGRQGWEAAQTEWMYLLFMWKSMGPDRWRFVSSLFTQRLSDKCPRRPSWADGAQVSRKPSLPFPPQMDDRCASYRPISFSL